MNSPEGGIDGFGVGQEGSAPRESISPGDKGGRGGSRIGGAQSTLGGKKTLQTGCWPSLPGLTDPDSKG